MLRTLVTAIMLGMFVIACHANHAGKASTAEYKDAQTRADGLKAFGENIEESNSTKLTFDISKAQSKSTKAFSKAGSSGGPKTTGDADAIGAGVSALVTDVAEEIAGCLGGPITDRSGDGRKVIVWFGDSNSVPDFLPGVLNSSWCQQIVDLVPTDWEIVCKDPFVFGLSTVIPTAGWSDALEQVGAALEKVEFDAAVLSYGTVDLIHKAKPREIVDAYRNITGILCNAGKSVYIATTPHVWPLERFDNLRVDAVNAALAAAFPSKALIDVTTGFDMDDYHGGDPFDGVHFSKAGQAIRAQRAAARLLSNSPALPDH